MKALFDLLKRLSDFQYPVFQVECPDFKFEYSIFRQKSAVIFSSVFRDYVAVAGFTPKTHRTFLTTPESPQASVRLLKNHT